MPINLCNFNAFIQCNIKYSQYSFFNLAAPGLVKHTSKCEKENRKVLKPFLTQITKIKIKWFHVTKFKINVYEQFFICLQNK